MTHVPIPETLIDLFRKEQVFVIVGHSEPDADCLCSILALASYLRRNGKTVYAVDVGPFLRPEIADLEPEFHATIPDDADSQWPDAPVIVVDCSTIDRIGDVAGRLGRRRVAVIDHHTSGEPFGLPELRFINSSAPASALLIQQLISELGGELLAEEAQLLLLGFATDTGFFRHLEGGSALSFRFVADLVETGANPKTIYTSITGGKTWESKKHLGMLLSNMERHLNGRLILVSESRADTETWGRSNRETDIFYQQCLAIAGVDCVVTLREDSDTHCSGGIRTVSRIDAGRLAAEFGGGGHVRAAGFYVQGSLAELRDKIIARVSELLPTNPAR